MYYSGTSNPDTIGTGEVSEFQGLKATCICGSKALGVNLMYTRGLGLISFHNLALLHLLNDESLLLCCIT